MIKICAGLTVLLLLATTAQASFAPATSPVPQLRAGGQNAVKNIVQANPKIAPNALNTSPIPRLRHNQNTDAGAHTRQEISTLIQRAELERQQEVFGPARTKESTTKTVRKSGLLALDRSMIPRLRPEGLGENRSAKRIIAKAPTQKKTKRRKKRIFSRRGSVCGVRSIKGTTAPRINGRGACGIANPVKVTEVAGVSLTRELVVNCTTAKRLDKWVSRSVKPAIGRKGGGLSSIQIIGGYSCRTRNSRRGAKLSEHAKGNAVDIAGFKLNNGTIYSVKRDWHRGRGKKPLRKIHKSACGPFGTVLGPNADRHHRDHFHLDVARHRGGAYCR